MCWLPSWHGPQTPQPPQKGTVTRSPPRPVHHARPHRRHHAREFVPRHVRQLYRRIVTHPGVPIRTADAVGPHLDDDPVLGWLGVGDGGYAQGFLKSSHKRRFHGYTPFDTLYQCDTAPETATSYEFAFITEQAKTPPAHPLLQTRLLFHSLCSSLTSSLHSVAKAKWYQVSPATARPTCERRTTCPKEVGRTGWTGALYPLLQRPL